MSKLISIFKDAREELSKVIFPTKQQQKSAMLSVFVVVTFVALFLSMIDAIMSSILSWLIGG
jgi:preprotein translocase subunit SecE